MADEQDPRPTPDDAPEPQEGAADEAEDAAQEGGFEHAAHQEAAASAAEEEQASDEFGIDQKRMTFGEHLSELRGRILICIATVAGAFLLFFLVLSQPLYELLVQPVKRAARHIAADVAEATGERAAQETVRLIADAGEGPIEPKAIAQAVADRVDGVEERSVAESLQELLAASGGRRPALEDVRKVVANAVARAARRVVDPAAFLVADNPTSMFVTSAFFALLAAIALTVPVTGYQLWAFVAPGLKRKERRFVWPILTIGTGLFVLGAVFAYLTVVPIALRFLMGYTVRYEGVRVLWKVRDTVKFEAILVLVFGLAFEMPLVITALTRVGLISPDTIAKNRRYAILGMFVVGALLTPPDVVTQLLLAAPLVVLFEISILSARFFKPKHTLWEPWDETDYDEAWESSVVSDEDIGPPPSPPPAGPTEPPTGPTRAPSGEGAAPEHEADYSYEEEYYDEYAEYDPYAYGEEAYRPEPGEEERLEELRKDLRRRRKSRHVRRPGPQGGRRRGRGRPNA